MRVPWLAALLPGAAGIGIAWFTHSPVFLLFALLTPLTLAASASGDRLSHRRDRRRAAAAHAGALALTGRQVADALAAETAARRDAVPDLVVDLCDGATSGCSPLGTRQRRRRHRARRIGRRALDRSRPHRCAVRRRRRRARRAADRRPARRSGGARRAGRRHPGVSARAMLLQLCVLHPPADVAVAFDLDDGSADAWHWGRWLPHARARCRRRDLDGDRRRHRTGRRRDPTGLGDRARVAGVPAAGGLRHGRPGGRRDAGQRAVRRRRGGRHRRHGGHRLGRDGGAAAGAARRRRPDRGRAAARPLLAARPARLSRAEPEGIAGGWAGDDGRADTVLGVTADGPFALDLDADGPHALVAGTTGSGKSELLQSLVAGLALRHPPDALAFLLVDYKGGAAFGTARACRTPSDWSPISTRTSRAGAALLDAELRRRERLLADGRRADSGTATARGGEPRCPGWSSSSTSSRRWPRSCPTSSPDWSASRSAGARWVCTSCSRPSGRARAVSAEIRANTGLRIALRVTDAGRVARRRRRDAAARAAPRDVPGPGRCAGDGRRCCSRPRRRRSGPADRMRWTRPRSDPGADPPPHPSSDPRPARRRRALAAAGRAGAPVRPPWPPPLPALLALDGEPDRVGSVDLPAPACQAGALLRRRRADDRGCWSAPAAPGAPPPSRPRPCGAALGRTAGAGHPRDRLPTARSPAAVGAPSATSRGLRPADLELRPRLADAAPRQSGDPGPAPALVVGRVARIAPRRRRRPAGLRSSGRAPAPAPTTSCRSGDRSLLAAAHRRRFDKRFALRLTDRDDYALLASRPARAPRDRRPGAAVRAGDGAEVQFGIPPGAGCPAAPPARRLAARRGHGRQPGPRHAAAVRVRALPPRAAGRRCPRDGRLLRRPRWDAGRRSASTRCRRRQLLVAGPPPSGRTTLLPRCSTEATAAAGRGRGPGALTAARRRARRGVPRLGPSGAVARAVPAGLLLVDDARRLRRHRRPADLLGVVLERRTGPPGRPRRPQRRPRHELPRAGRGTSAGRAAGAAAARAASTASCSASRLPRRATPGPPGRGRAGRADGSRSAARGRPRAVPIQVAQVDDPCSRRLSPCAGSDDRSAARTSP